MPGVYATARGPLARLAGPLAARARAGATRLLPAQRAAGGRADARRRLRRARAAGARAGARHHRRRPRRATRLSGAVRAGRRQRAAAVRRRRVRPRVLLERDRARPACAPRGFAAELRRVGRGWMVQTPACSFPIEPHSLLPGRPLAAGRDCGGATGGSARRATGRRSRCSAARELEALFGPARPERLGPLVKSWVCVRPPAPRGSAARRLMSLLTPLTTRNSSSTIPTEL